MWVHLFSDSLMGVKAEPPNQLLPEPRLALPWRRVFPTPRPAAQGWGAQPARGGPGWPAERRLRGLACTLVFLCTGALADSLAQTRAA